jgi:uncharacterized membrane protein
MATSLRRLVVIALLSLALNLWGITWGLPERWYPDEVTWRAENLVYERTLNPHFFAYGTLHYYQLLAFPVLPIKVVNKTLTVFDQPTEASIIVILSRTLSALFGAGTVLAAGILAQQLFGPAAALFSALLLAISMGLVNISHFATVDSPSVFWFTVSCLLSSYVLTRGDRKWYLLAGLTAGLAAAVKYVGGLALVTVFVAHFLADKRRSPQDLLAAVLGAAAGIAVGTPVLFFAPLEFIEGFVKEAAFTANRNVGSPHVFLALIGKLRNALGVPPSAPCSIASDWSSIRPSVGGSF